MTCGGKFPIFPQKCSLQHYATWRTREFNGLDLSKEDFLEILRERLSKTNIKLVKDDVSRFVNNVKDLDIWSNDYFLQLAERIRFA